VISKEARGPLLEFAEARWGRLPADRHRRGSLNVTFADGHGNFVKRIPGGKYGTGTYLPDYSYQPKARVSPYEMGTYPVP
jgi:prepilin-type processing-associated H-X9-DG protein